MNNTLLEGQTITIALTDYIDMKEYIARLETEVCMNEKINELNSDLRAVVEELNMYKGV